MKNIDLNGLWDLIEMPLDAGVEAYGDAARATALCKANVPGDVSDALFRAGLIPDYKVGLNFKIAAERANNSSWWLRREFENVNFEKTDKNVCSTLDPRARAVLSLGGLDVRADIWLNGTHIGHHPSAFYPFEKDVLPLLKKAGNNTIIVRLTTGADRNDYPDYPLLNTVGDESARDYEERGKLPHRIFLRKPAYSFGWDWSPNMPTCGIAGDCEMRVENETEIESVKYFTRLEKVGRLANGVAVVRCVAEIRRNTLLDSASGTIVFKIGKNKSKPVEFLVRSGITVVEAEVRVKKPLLWWPNGTGCQSMHTATATLTLANGETLAHEAEVALRTVAIDDTPGTFRVVVNGVPVFAKGGNWVPPEHLHGTITDDQLRLLVREARDANFNMLRIWGGGRFERDAFYDECDKCGIMIWHDFMAACSVLPADVPGFRETFLAEARYQIKRLHNHPSLALWCGNNEVGQCYGWFAQKMGDVRDPAWGIYFEDLPRIVAAEAPGTPYWPTSPYGEPTPSKINAPDAVARSGDDHHWVVMRPDSKFWSWPEYWDGDDIPVFNSEYGFGGPCCEKSTRQFLGLGPDDPIPLEGPVAKQHTNTFYTAKHVLFSIGEHYGECGTGLPTRPDDKRETGQETCPTLACPTMYLRLGGMCQGLNLGYSLESLRANRQTWGGIFWMYNDAWGETGWTIIDNYLRRKISYWNVRRALAPVTFVWRRGGGAFGGNESEVVLIGINETDKTVKTNLFAGWCDFQPSAFSLQPLPITLPPRSKQTVLVLPSPESAGLSLATGTYIARDGDNVYELRRGRYKDAPLPPAVVGISGARKRFNDLEITLKTDVAAHAVHLDLPDGFIPDDNYFDMWPAFPKTVRIKNGASLNVADIVVKWHNA